MKELAHKIPGTINEILQANNEVINCYEQVKDTVGPHTNRINCKRFKSFFEGKYRNSQWSIEAVEITCK